MHMDVDLQLSPEKWYGEKVFGRIRSPKAKKSSLHLEAAGGQYADNVL